MTVNIVIKLVESHPLRLQIVIKASLWFHWYCLRSMQPTDSGSVHLHPSSFRRLYYLQIPEDLYSYSHRMLYEKDFPFCNGE